MPESRLGFIGLGAMGNPIASRLIEAGHQVTVFDLSIGAVDDLVTAGGRRAASAAEVAAGSDVVFTSLPNAAAVEQVVLGELGLASSMAPGSVLVDLSSSKPSSARRVAAALAERGIDVLDAPLSRGVPAARSGTLSIMVGGDLSVLERCRPYLEIIGSDIFHVGGIGTGHAMKALNNLLSATLLLSGVEAVLIGVRFGLEPRALVDVFNRGRGRTNVTDERFHRYILSRTYRSNFALALMNKDIQTAIELAQEVGSPLFVTSLTRELYSLAARSDRFRHSDNQEMALFMEDFVGSRMFSSDLATPPGEASLPRP